LNSRALTSLSAGELRSDNRWIRLAKLVPWQEIERRYAGLFSETRGPPAISARAAVASLIIKEKLGLTDDETIEQIRENPYLQYLLGWEAYRDEQPFDSSMMVHFRKRLSDSVLSEINELVVQQASRSSDDADDHETSTRGGEQDGAVDASESEQEPPNSGRLLMDASCTPADIRYPTDLSLVNEVREKSEEIIDVLHHPDIGRTEKPRTYRRKARKDYLAVAKKRKPSARQVRKAIGKQLRYIGRNLNNIHELAPGRLMLLKPDSTAIYWCAARSTGSRS
jgi:transposase, IS5 family